MVRHCMGESNFSLDFRATLCTMVDAMKQYTPALNGLEQAAFTLIAVQQASIARGGSSRVAQDAWHAALEAFVNAEAEYHGNEVQPWEFYGAHSRAEELCKGL